MENLKSILKHYLFGIAMALLFIALMRLHSFVFSPYYLPAKWKNILIFTLVLGIFFGFVFWGLMQWYKSINNLDSNLLFQEKMKLYITKIVVPFLCYYGLGIGIALVIIGVVHLYSFLFEPYFRYAQWRNIKDTAQISGIAFGIGFYLLKKYYFGKKCKSYIIN